MALKRWLWSNLPQLIGVAVIGGVLYESLRRENERVRLQHEADLATEAAREVVLARGDFAEMLALCREGWKGASFHQEPVAIAWTRRGVDAYFLKGTDTTSVRQVRCDAKGVERGPRVDHPLEERMPAESPSDDADDSVYSEWSAAIVRASARRFAPGEVAFELLLHPFSRRALSRRWIGGPEGATATHDPPDAPPFAFLPSETFPVVGKGPPALRIRERKRWAADDGAAFAFLAKQLPKNARISELSLDEDEIQVQIEGKIPAFDGKPPVPYGDKTFDEYGVADFDWWYPRESTGFGCTAGRPLGELITAFGVAKAQRGGRPITRAWYSCSTAYSNGRSGVWHLAPSGD
jgi:hypothetical protein